MLSFCGSQLILPAMTLEAQLRQDLETSADMKGES